MLVKLIFYFFSHTYIIIYEQYNPEMARRNAPKPERSVPIEKPERRPERY